MLKGTLEGIVLALISPDEPTTGLDPEAWQIHPPARPAYVFAMATYWRKIT